LHFLNDFISEKEEETLLQHLDMNSSSWEKSLNRRVQHYGFAFNYRTLMLDFSMEPPPIPSIYDNMIQRFENLVDTHLTDILTYTTRETQMTQDISSEENAKACHDNGLKKVNNNIDDLASAEEAKKYNTSLINDARLVHLPINQLTVNEYEPGQGIAPHIGEPIITIRIIVVMSLIFRYEY
jgi:hypothetical protein